MLFGRIVSCRLTASVVRMSRAIDLRTIDYGSDVDCHQRRWLVSVSASKSLSIHQFSGMFAHFRLGHPRDGP